MTNYSAAQAISPAIEITKHFLFKPFRWQTFLKLALVAMLTEGGMSSCNFNSSFPSGNTNGQKVPFHWPHLPAMHLHWPAMIVVVGVVAAVLLLCIPIYLLVAYLLIRLRFSYFDCLLNRQRLIAPAWRRYHRQALRYLGLNLMIGVAVWIATGGVGVAIYLHFKALFQSLLGGGQPSFSEFLPVIAVAGPFFVLLAIFGGLLDTALSNFVLPRMALDDASIQDSLEDVWIDVKAEPGQFILFVLLKFLLGVVGSICGFIAIFIPMLFLVGIGALFVILLKGISTATALALGIPAALLLVAVLFLAIIALGGTIGTFRRSYAMVFYAGRYPTLGEILQPTPPMPIPPPPAAWPSGSSPDPQIL